jgi:chromate transporter
MVAYIRRMAVEQHKWFDHDSFRNGVALYQSLPGATALQMSAYMGHRTRGVSGVAVTSAFDGLRAIIVTVVANATITFGKSVLKGWSDLILTWCALKVIVY